MSNVEVPNISYNVPVTYATFFTKQINEFDSYLGKKYVAKSELPDCIHITKDGLLFGIPYYENNKQKILQSLIHVYSDDELIGLITINWIYADSIHLVWQTPMGIIGSINYNDDSRFKLSAYVNGLSNAVFTYEIIEGELPNGLSLSNDGKIVGKCESSFINELYTFKVKASFIHGEYTNYDIRDFSIIVNPTENDIKIFDMVDDILNIGDIHIGDLISYKIKTNKNNLTFKLDGGELPLGLSISDDGFIFGKVDYQNSKVYTFFIKIIGNQINKIIKCTLNLCKWLGKNSMDVSLKINKEFLDEYNRLRANYDLCFQAHNPKYFIPTTPRIKVCTTETYDPILLSNLLSFDSSLKIKILEEQKKKFINENDDEYEVFYKKVVEV